MFLQIFVVSPPIFTPIASPFFKVCRTLPTPHRLDTWVGQVQRGQQTKMIPLYPGYHIVWSALSEFFLNLNKGRMWWYNILGNNERIFSHILRLDTITAGYILLTASLVALKRGNSEPILRVTITELRKFIDYFGLIIEANPSRVGNKNVYFVRVGYILSTSYVNTHIAG